MTNYVIPGVILVVFIVGIKEKKDVFKLFVDGVEQGIRSIIGLIPIIIAFFFFSGMFISLINVESKFGLIFSTFILKMFSGSAAQSFGISALEKVGVDSSAGLIISVVLASTETVFFILSIYLKDKKIFPTVVFGLIVNLIALLITMLTFT